jgi:dihydroorotate dehydrogenase
LGATATGSAMVDALWSLLRPILFQLDAEQAHRLVIGGLARFPSVARLALGSDESSTGRKETQLCGRPLRSPIGLAAGLDKDGEALTVWPSLGFGFVELGTVTAEPQPGNPRPRLFRLPAEKALINRMGFNNEGSAALADRLRAVRAAGRWPDVPVGANIGKSKVTPLAEAETDYVRSLERLQGLVDYVTVNVSSPNTPGLRSLQDPERLYSLVRALLPVAQGTPLFVKLAPDFQAEALAEVVEGLVAAGVQGIIATNTTISRPGTTGRTQEEGGLSGAPLWPLARERIGTVVATVRGRVPVIGVGGISRAEQVEDLLALGCSAVQLYTALIFEGPGLVRRMNRRLVAERRAA